MERALGLRETVAAGVAAAALSLAGVHLLPPLAAADRLVTDTALARLTPERPQHGRVAVIAITEETLAALPYRTPLDRDLLAGLVEALRAKGVAAIGLDVLVDQPTEAVKDQRLRQVVTTPGAPVVLLAAAPATPLTPRQRAHHRAFLEGLRSGHGNLARDRLDGVVRRQAPEIAGLPSLPAALAQAAGAGARPLHQPGVIDWLRAPRGETAFPLYPAEAVPLLPRSWLEGRVVLVGLVVPDADRHRTPVTLGSGTMPGVVIQAHILAQMLDGRISPLVGEGARAAAVVLAAAAGAVLAALLPAGPALAAALGLLALAWAGAALSTVLGGPVLSPLAPGLALMLSLGSGLGLAGWRERRARATLMDLFAAHLSAPVAQEIWRHRATLLAGGRPKPSSLTATVIFSDVENFTPLSERLGPERLMAWAETYMEAMTEEVVGHGGVVLRFLGDGILAAFGVPLPRMEEAEVAEDARRAVEAALAMERRLDRLNLDWSAEGLPPVCIRVGMVTGPMVGGSIGARRHLEYTLMGDVVNTAARLEALAKTVGNSHGRHCRILAARSTWERVARVVEARPVGAVALKGKDQTVEVYQILGLCSEPEEGRGRLGPAGS